MKDNNPDEDHATEMESDYADIITTTGSQFAVLLDDNRVQYSEIQSNVTVKNTDLGKGITIVHTKHILRPWSLCYTIVYRVCSIN